MEINKKNGVLLLDSNKENRFYLNLAINSQNSYTTKSASNSKEAFSIIESAQRDEIDLIVLNSDFCQDKCYLMMQKIKNHPTTFLSSLILMADDLSEDSLYLLEELSVSKIIPTKSASLDVIKSLNDIATERKKLNSNFSDIYEFTHAIKNNDLKKCRIILENYSTKNTLETNQNYIYLYGEYLFLEKRFEECYALLHKTVKSSNFQTGKNQKINTLNVYAKILCYYDRFDEALLIYKEMADKSPNNLNHQINLSQMYIANSEWKTAIEILDRVLAKDPKNKEALLNQVQAYAAIDEIEKANTLLEMIPGSIEIKNLISFFNNRGVAYARKNQYHNALSFYKNALFFSKKDATKVLFNIYLCLMKAQKTEMAAKILLELEKLDDFKEFLINKQPLKNLNK